MTFAEAVRYPWRALGWLAASVALAVLAGLLGWYALIVSYVLSGLGSDAVGLSAMGALFGALACLAGAARTVRVGFREWREFRQREIRRRLHRAADDMAAAVRVTWGGGGTEPAVVRSAAATRALADGGARAPRPMADDPERRDRSAVEPGGVVRGDLGRLSPYPVWAANPKMIREAAGGSSRRSVAEPG